MNSIETLIGQRAVFHTNDRREWTGTVDGVTEDIVHLRDAKQAGGRGTVARLSVPISSIVAWGASTEGETS